MKPNAQAIMARYNDIWRKQENNGLDPDHVAICNLVAAQTGYRVMDVLDAMEGKG